ncbi:MAG: hypothetical protein WCJ61_02240 [Paludibacter sp.]
MGSCRIQLLRCARSWSGRGCNAAGGDGRDGAAGLNGLDNFVEILFEVMRLMILSRNRLASGFAIAALLVLAFGSAGCRGKKYENPINKDTQQPDKVLFDKAINDIMFSE